MMTTTEFLYTQDQLDLQPRLADANINPTSFLATDYLNHYNEIVMLLEMIPDMPELVEDAVTWAPKSYPDHFRDSGFQDKHLAIEAYEAAPAPIRDAFLSLTQSLDQEIAGTVKALIAVDAAERGLNDQAQSFIRSKISLVQHDLTVLNGVIHGTLPQREETPVEAAVTDEQVQSQEEIDKLFD